ncbi:electron carrier/ protein disulfide oxidoreductase [Anaeramoeba flamelloides]|uniref:Electron carrier/ protein disulfide oxidoreductase n=1 Tax=Anaeramoeba flamelloides TaxID=1746091 RepID=A0AAV7YSR6_9EUKA|nr:electron carrier/ protein disulfide oxidoreductase [Anaeramoeba flamelloides]
MTNKEAIKPEKKHFNSITKKENKGEEKEKEKEKEKEVEKEKENKEKEKEKDRNQKENKVLPKEEEKNKASTESEDSNFSVSSGGESYSDDTDENEKNNKKENNKFRTTFELKRLKKKRSLSAVRTNSRVTKIDLRDQKNKNENQNKNKNFIKRNKKEAKSGNKGKVQKSLSETIPITKRNELKFNQKKSKKKLKLLSKLKSPFNRKKQIKIKNKGQLKTFRNKTYSLQQFPSFAKECSDSYNSTSSSTSSGTNSFSSSSLSSSTDSDTNTSANSDSGATTASKTDTGSNSNSNSGLDSNSSSFTSSNSNSESNLRKQKQMQKPAQTKKPKQKQKQKQKQKKDEQTILELIKENFKKKKDLELLKGYKNFSLEELRSEFKKKKFQNEQLKNQNERGNFEMKLARTKKIIKEKQKENENIEKEHQKIELKCKNLQEQIEIEKKEDIKIITEEDLEQLNLKIKQLKFEKLKLEKESHCGNLENKIEGTSSRIKNKLEEIEKIKDEIELNDLMIIKTWNEMEEVEKTNITSKTQELEQLESESINLQKRIKTIQFENKSLKRKINSLVSYSGKDRLMSIQVQLSTKERENRKLNYEIEELKKKFRNKDSSEILLSDEISIGSSQLNSEIEEDQDFDANKKISPNLNPNTSHVHRQDKDKEQEVVSNSEESNGIKLIFSPTISANSSIYNSVGTFMVDTASTATTTNESTKNGNSGSNVNSKARNSNNSQINTIGELLENDLCIEYFKEFLSQQLNQERFLFLIEIDLFLKTQLKDDLTELANNIHNKYLKENSLFEIKLKEEIKIEILKQIKEKEIDLHIFKKAKKVIKNELKDQFFQFKKSQLFQQYLNENKNKNVNNDNHHHTNHNHNNTNGGGDGIKGNGNNHDIQSIRIVAKQIDTSALNTTYNYQGEIRNPLLIAEKLMETLIDMLNAIYSVSSEQINCELFYQSISFRRFIVATAELQSIDLQIVEKFSNGEKIAFWLNIYNILALHSAIENNVPTDQLSSKKFLRNNKYKIGDNYLFSLSEIKYQILFGKIFNKKYKSKKKNKIKPNNNIIDDDDEKIGDDENNINDDDDNNNDNNDNNNDDDDDDDDNDNGNDDDDLNNNSSSGNNNSNYRFLNKKELFVKLLIDEIDERILFALVSLNSQSSTIRAYYSKTYDKQLEFTAKMFLSKYLQIDQQKKILYLPRVIYQFTNLFGSDTNEIIKYVLKKISNNDQENLLNDHSSYNIKFSKYQFFPILEFDSQYTVI